MRSRTVEMTVGGFVLLGILALVFLALRVSGLSAGSSEETYRVTAKFDNIGGLTPRAKITISGVNVGRVANIYLDKEDLMAVVEMDIYQRVDNLSTDTTAAILTSGILGEQYIGLTDSGGLFADAEPELLTEGSEIFDTQSALVLEKLISKFLVGRVTNDEEEP